MGTGDQYDPAEPIRGRYLALSVLASACGLNAGEDSSTFIRTPGNAWTSVPAKQWHVIPSAKGGKLAPVVVDAMRPGPTQELTLPKGAPCDYARLGGTSDFFIPEHAKSPFPLEKGQELWALVTVPPSGPVRPVKLAISDAQGFHVLNFD